MNDQELVQRILSRDRKALHIVYTTYTPKLLRFISTKVANPHDAEEILQDTLFAFLEAVRDFEGKARISTFLFSICQHKIVDYYRRKKLRHIVFSQMPTLEELVSPLLGPEEEMDVTIVRERLKKTFDLLLPKYRMVLRMKYEEDLPVEVIATTLHMTFKSVESMLFRARKAFGEAFASV